MHPYQHVRYNIELTGIYLAHNGNCFPNGSYLWDSSVNAFIEAISCVLPGTSLTTGQWVRVADPDDPVDCNSNGSNDNDNFHCTSVTSPKCFSLSCQLNTPLIKQVLD